MTADPSIHRFRQVVGVALSHLEARRAEINDLNVFPVADGDTGDNMALTMRHVLDGLAELEREAGDPARPEIVRTVARAALMGARGNSGVILSQIVRGAAENLATPPGRLIDPELVKEGLCAASDAAQASVRDPQPGTMLTVIETMADAVAERVEHWRHHRLDTDATEAEQNALLAEMMTTALFAGEEAVRHTPEQLDVLAEHGVVDAGALGLVVIVRGLVAGLAGEAAQLPEIPHYAPPARSHDVHHADPAYRWCTNFVVTGERLDGSRFVPRLEELGDSVLVVGDEATIKVHVHTDDAEAAKALFDGVGEIVQEDIADMHDQVAERDARLRESRSVVLAVASGNGMAALFRGLGAVTVDGGPTLNPSTQDLVDAIEHAAAREVVLLPNSPNVRMAAAEAAELAAKEVAVVNCDSQQAALAALPESDAQADAAENAERLASALDRIRSGGVAQAVKDDAQGRFVRGDAVGFVAGELVAWGGAGSTLLEVLERLGQGAELVTVLVSPEAPIPTGELPGELAGGAELEVHEVGQPGWWWLITAE